MVNHCVSARVYYVRTHTVVTFHTLYFRGLKQDEQNLHAKWSPEAVTESCPFFSPHSLYSVHYQSMTPLRGGPILISPHFVQLRGTAVRFIQYVHTGIISYENLALCTHGLNQAPNYTQSNSHAHLKNVTWNSFYKKLRVHTNCFLNAFWKQFRKCIRGTPGGWIKIKPNCLYVFIWYTKTWPSGPDFPTAETLLRPTKHKADLMLYSSCCKPKWKNNSLPVWASPLCWSGIYSPIQWKINQVCILAAVFPWLCCSQHWSDYKFFLSSSHCHVWQKRRPAFGFC